MSHTKGPWRYDAKQCAIVSETEFYDDVLTDDDDPPMPADLALIIAAPELLVLLEEAGSFYTMPSALKRKIEAVLAKAKPV
jgi:hypothetical protein